LSRRDRKKYRLNCITTWYFASVLDLFEATDINDVSDAPAVVGRQENVLRKPTSM
jgi:hypothetical protein